MSVGIFILVLIKVFYLETVNFTNKPFQCRNTYYCAHDIIGD